MLFSLPLEFTKMAIPRKEIIQKKWNQFIALEPPAIYCHPPPKHIWTKNGVIIQETKDMKMTANGTLYITNIDDNAMGDYELKMENTFLRGKGRDNAIQRARIITLNVYGE